MTVSREFVWEGCEMTHLSSRDELRKNRLSCLLETVKQESERTGAVAQVDELLEE